MANIKQVAAMAGVSTATVSKYLNGIRVKEYNKTAIDEAIAKLEYKRNPTARGLRTHKSMTIGVLIPELDNLFATSIISTIENIIIKKGYSTIICDYKSDRELEVKKLNFLIDRLVDGIIVMPSYLTKDDIAHIDVPTVFIDRKIDSVNSDFVVVDNADASFNATNYLMECGHKKIGVILGPKYVYTSQERFKGYESAFKSKNMELNSNYIINGNYDIKTGHDATIQLIKMKNPPTAIYATNYEITLGAIIALNEMNINVPDEISLVGFDNQEMANVVRPKVTIVAQPIEKIGKYIARTILEHIENPDKETTCKVLKTNLIIQDSVKNI